MTRRHERDASTDVQQEAARLGAELSLAFVKEALLAAEGPVRMPGAPTTNFGSQRSLVITELETKKSQLEAAKWPKFGDITAQ